MFSNGKYPDYGLVRRNPV